MSTESVPTTTSTKLAIGGGMLAAGLALGAMFSPLGSVGAQESDVDDSTVDEGTLDRADRLAFRANHRHLGEALEELGLTEDQVRAGIEADQSLLQIAEANGITEAELVAALEAEATEHLADAVESGRLTQDEADERLADLDDRIAERINELPSERQEQRQERREERRANRLEPLTDLGLTIEDIQAGRQDGQTLAETAEANGISEDELVDALVAAAVERADAAVESGRITQDEADEKQADVEERITERVNAEPGDSEGRRGGLRNRVQERFDA